MTENRVETTYYLKPFNVVRSWYGDYTQGIYSYEKRIYEKDIFPKRALMERRAISLHRAHWNDQISYIMCRHWTSFGENMANRKISAQCGKSQNTRASTNGCHVCWLTTRQHSLVGVQRGVANFCGQITIISLDEAKEESEIHGYEDLLSFPTHHLCTSDSCRANEFSSHIIDLPSFISIRLVPNSLGI